MTDNTLSPVEQAYAQAKKYGEELAQLYTAEKTRRRELETTTQKLQAIFDTAPNALAVIDNNLAVVEANSRFLSLFEQTGHCIGCPIASFLPEEALLEAVQSMEAESASLNSVEIEITEPVFRTLLVALSPLGNKQGWVLTLHDLTERKRLEGLKDEFINIAAHELRTPLAGVMGFVSVLQESLQDVDDPMVTQVTNLILESTERLKVIVDELVQFAAAQRGAVDDLHITNIDLASIVQKSVKLLQQQIEAGNITCQFDLPPQPLTIQGDQFILSEVVYQLLKNAVLFNKPGGRIAVRARRLPSDALEEMGQEVRGDGEEGEISLIEIEDTGIGIPQTDLEKVFDKFYQVEEHLTRGVGGLGLGLTIARRGVEQHGGKVTITSKLDQGTTVRVMLPPITQLRDVSIDNRLDVTYQQMLFYAKDMARAVTSQRKMKKKMEQVKILSTDLAKRLNQLSVVQPGTEAHSGVLKEVQGIIRELWQLSAQDVA